MMKSERVHTGHVMGANGSTYSSTIIVLPPSTESQINKIEYIIYHDRSRLYLFVSQKVNDKFEQKYVKG